MISKGRWDSGGSRKGDGTSAYEAEHSATYAVASCAVSTAASRVAHGIYSVPMCIFSFIKLHIAFCVCHLAVRAIKV